MYIIYIHNILQSLDIKIDDRVNKKILSLQKRNYRYENDDTHRLDTIMMT